MKKTIKVSRSAGGLAGTLGTGMVRGGAIAAVTALAEGAVDMLQGRRSAGDVASEVARASVRGAAVAGGATLAEAGAVALLGPCAVVPVVGMVAAWLLGSALGK